MLNGIAALRIHLDYSAANTHIAFMEKIEKPTLNGALNWTPCNIMYCVKQVQNGLRQAD